MLFKKSKKNIAILLVIAMLLTIMPMTVFAEGEEGAVFGAALTYTVNEEDTTLFNLRADVTSGSHLITTPSLLQVNWVVNGTEEGFTTAGIQNEGDTAFYAQKELTVAGNTTVKAIFDYDGVQFESNEVTIEAEAKSCTVNNTMTQEDIQAAIDVNDEIVFESGTYEDLSVKITHDVSIIPKGEVVFKYLGKLPNDNGPFGIEQVNGDLTIKLENDAIMTVDGYGAGIFQNENAIDVAINVIGYGTLNLVNSKNLAPGEAAGMFLHSKGEKIVNIIGNSDIEYVVLNCSGNMASGIDWYPNSEDTEKELKMYCQNAKIYTNDNQYNGINLQTDNGVDRNHNPVIAEMINCYFESCRNTGGSGVMNNWGNATYDDHNIVWKLFNTEIVLNNNKLDGFTSSKLILEKSKIIANSNGRGGVVGISLDANNSYIEGCENKSQSSFYGGLRVHSIIGHESDDMYSYIKNTEIVTNNNGSYGTKFQTFVDGYEINAKILNSKITAKNNGNSAGLWLNGTADIINSEINADENGTYGVYAKGYLKISEDTEMVLERNKNYGVAFVDGGEIKDSTIETKNNKGGITNKEAVTIINSYIPLNENNENGIGHNFYILTEKDQDGNIISKEGNGEYYILKDTVSSVGAKVLEFTGSSEYVQYTYVLGGSLQAIRNNMTNAESYYKLNGTVDNNGYAAPINKDKTMLTRFNLNAEKNVEIGLTVEDTEKVSKSFTYYDPNNKDSRYDYQFRFNKDGEDLVEGESGNAYVWAPVSVLHYDATEGKTTNTVDVTKADNSTAYIGNVALFNTRGDGSAVGNQGDVAQSDNRYATDYTIYGNSLQLSEGIMPTAAREGYAFAGWFVADDEELAKTYAANGEFENLYKLLNTEFTAASKVATDLNDVSTAQAEKTIYAKWTKGKVDGTIFEDGIRNDRLDDNESRFEDINVKLLKDGVQVATTTTDANGYYKFVDVDFGNYTVEIEWPEKDNDTMDNICAVSNHEMGNKFTAGADKAFAASQAVTISKDNLEATLNAGFYNTSDGGGGWTPTDPGTDEPTVDIPDQDVPLTEPEEPTIDIEDPDVPLVDVPGETVEIEEPEVPLGDAPATGDRSAAIPFAVLMLIAAAGLAITRKRFN